MASPPTDSDPSLGDPWVILRTVPRVRAWHRDVFFEELADPPQLSFLTVSTGVSSPPQGIRRPHILTADLSASLFLTAAWTPHPPAAAAPTTSASGPAADGSFGYIYIVLDAASLTPHRLPVVPDPGSGPGYGCFGVISAPDDGGASRSFMVVGIRCLAGHATASLQCFSSRTGRWVTKAVNNPRRHTGWIFNNVIAHEGKLWWVVTTRTATTTKGLLCYDPFAAQPSMSFVAFPDHVTAVEARADATAYDYVQVAGGALCWVHVLYDCDETDAEAPSLGGAPLLSIYTVVVAAGDDGNSFSLELERSGFSFSSIWESDTFKAAEMPKDGQQPIMFVLIDPNDTDLLYFFLGDYLFGFDICKHVLLGYAPHGMARADATSSSVIAWKLPPALAAPEAQRRFGSRELKAST